MSVGWGEFGRERVCFRGCDCEFVEVKLKWGWFRKLGRDGIIKRKIMKG